jgi:hypothetical protein
LLFDYAMWKKLCSKTRNVADASRWCAKQSLAFLAG